MTGIIKYPDEKKKDSFSHETSNVGGDVAIKLSFLNVCLFRMAI